MQDDVLISRGLRYNNEVYRSFTDSYPVYICIIPCTRELIHFNASFVTSSIQVNLSEDVNMLIQRGVRHLNIPPVNVVP